MQRKTTVLGWVILAVGLVALSACGTTRQATVVPEEPLAQDEVDGISADLRYIDEATLKRDFGTGTNPFLTQYYRLTFRRIFVFELTLRNNSGIPVELELTKCEFDYGARPINPINRFQLGNYWEGLDYDDPRIVNDKKKIIERWVLPNRAVVADGSTRFGYMVFMGNVSRKGEGTVYVPVFREGGSATLRFDYTF